MATIKLNLQRFAGSPSITSSIYVNGEQFEIEFLSLDNTFQDILDNGLTGSDNYSISNNQVIWNNGEILVYNGTDVLPSDAIVELGQYTTRSGGTNMSKIKIKIKESTSIVPFEIGISFISNGTLYSKISGNGKMQLLYNDFVVNSDSSSWANPNYQYIEIDPTQTNFNAFITAMKSNIDGVELEAGTYKWVDIPTNILEDASGNLTGEFPFVSNGKNLSYIGVEDVGSNQVTISYTGIDFDAYVLNDVGWTNYAYKIITTTENQYVDYDFYNYAILGNQLVKQTPTPTAIKLFYYNNKLVSSKGKLLH